LIPENLPESPAQSVIGVPGVQVVKRADEDPPAETPEAKSRPPETGFQGSVVGIQNWGWKMYTGTLIKDLVATVEQAERGALQKRLVDEMELRRMFALQVPQTHSESAYAGAA
jgi:hypothetical protein